MHYSEGVARLNNTNYSPCEPSCFSFCVMPSFHNPIEQLTPCTQLHHDVNSNSILICLLNGDHIRTPSKVVHYLNLPPHILHIFLRQQFPLQDGLASILFPTSFLQTKESC